MTPFLCITNITFYFSDFVLFLCLYGCMPPSCTFNANNRKSLIVTIILFKAIFTGNRNITLCLLLVSFVMLVNRCQLQSMPFGRLL